MQTEQRLLKTAEIYVLQPSEAAERAGRFIYESPDATDTHVQQLREELDRYRGIIGGGADSLAVQHAANRALCMATSAPIYHLMELEADRRFLAAVQDGRLDVSVYTEGMGPYETRLPLEGEYARFAHYNGMVNQWAAERVLRRVQNFGDPYHKAWQYFGDFLPQFVATEKKIRGFERATDPAVALKNVFSHLGTDTALPMLMQVIFQLQSNHKRRGHLITSRLIYHAEELSWAARTKRGFFGQHFPLSEEQSGTTPSCPFRPTGKKTITSSSLYEQMALWQNPSMDDFKDPPGFCPAAIELKPPTKEAQGVVEDMFVLQYNIRKRLFTRMYGTAMAAELNLIRSIFLLGKTVLHEFE